MAKKKQQGKTDKEVKPYPDTYNRHYIVQELLRTAQDEKGIARINALKEVRSMLDEETPPSDLEVDVAFVPLIFDGENFRADKSKAVKLS